jgi:PAS domain S-box-containing protein
MSTEPPGRERRHTRGRRLTDRQTAVLELVAAGLGNKEIAHELGISEQAVKEHVSNLLRLLAAPNRAALGEAAAMLQFVGTADLGNEWLSLLFLRAPLLIALLEGADHRFISVNEAYRRAAGTRELLGRTFREAYPDLDETGIVTLLDESYRAGEPRSSAALSATWYRDPPDAMARGFLTTFVQPMRQADGTVGGVVLFALDVTDEVEARNAARDLSVERDAILEQLPSGVVTVDVEGRVSTINAMGRRILGVGDEAIGQYAWEALTFIDPRTGQPVPSYERPLRRALRGEAQGPSEFRGLVTATGTTIEMRVSAAPLFGADGKVRGAVAVFTPSRPLD